MSMVLQALVEGKGLELQSQMEELQGFIRTAAATGLAMHEVEQGLFKRLLALGYQLQQWFFALLGDGDQGETVTTGEGRVLRRLPNLHRRAYQSIFGCFDLERVAYGTREGQRIEHVPLDARLSLPAGKFSYLLQDWDQGLAVESPYQQFNEVLQRMLGLEQSVASLEQMTRTMAEAVEGFWAEQAPVPAARAEQIVVLSADGKGVPMRKPAATPPIAAHQHQQGPKPGRKKMAGVGAVYQVDRYQRTPEEVVQALFREPGAAAPRDESAPSRPVPEHQRSRVNLTAPGAATVGPTEAMFAWLADEARSRDPWQQLPWVVLMDGQSSLWEEAKQALGEAPRVEILDLLHATSPLWDAVHLFHAPGSALALKLMELLVLALLSGMSEGVVNLALGCGSAGRAHQEPTAPVDQDLQLLAPPSGPNALRRGLGRGLPDRLRRHRGSLPARGQGPDGAGGHALDAPRCSSLAAAALCGPQRGVGGVHALPHPAGDSSALSACRAG